MPVHPLLQRTFLAVLLAALLLAQTLGTLHRASSGLTGLAALQTHGHVAPDVGQEASAVRHAHSDSAGWLPALFASHSQSGDCQLFDQAAAGDAATFAHLPALQLPVLACLIRHSLGEFNARQAALPWARGPPLTN